MTSHCIHEFPLGQCGYCKEIPFGINGVGFRTKYGNAFHNWKNCEYLESGQSFAVSRGGEATDIDTITWSAASDGFYPCEWCCALFYTKGIGLEDCIIMTSDGEKFAKIVKDRYRTRSIREYQIYYPESGELEILTNQYVKRFK
jgi:hypothetical protein